MKMIMRANATQVSVSTWNIDGDGWSFCFSSSNWSENSNYEARSYSDSKKELLIP